MWPAPQPDPARNKGPGDAPWYSFDYGPIHFTVMSTEHAYAPGSAQHEWLKQDLLGGGHDDGALDKAKTPFCVFTGHRPMYINTTWPPDLADTAAMRAALEPLLLEAGVDLAFWGHHHSYQRTCATFNLTCRAAGTAPVHMVVGTGGGALMSNFPPGELTTPWLDVLDDTNFGFVHLDADAETMVARYVVDNGAAVRDEVVFHAKATTA